MNIPPPPLPADIHWRPYIFERNGIMYVAPARGVGHYTGWRWPRKVKQPGWLERRRGIVFSDKLNRVLTDCLTWCVKENDREDRARRLIEETRQRYEQV